MSGPQLTALVASVVALAALAGVLLLVVQVRRLRAEVAEAKSADATAAGRIPTEAPGTDPAGPELSDPGSGPVPGHGTVVELLPEPAPDLATSRREATVSPGVQALVEPVARRLVQVSAVSYGVRRALRAENRDRVAALVRRDLRRRRKLRMRAARRAFRVVPMRGADRVQPEERQDWAS
jgi:hypothetical protein